MDRQTYAIAKAKQIFPDLGEIEARLTEEPNAFLPEEGSGAPGLFSIDSGDGRGTTRDEEKLRLLNAGRRGLTKIRMSGDEPPQLSPEETIGLEAIIHVEGRPAILIREGRFDTPPMQWRHLESYRESIESVFPAVGRIEVRGHPRLDWVGTGFLVGPDVIMTNRHVAVHFAERKRGRGWSFISGRRTSIDFREEYETPSSAEYTCVEVVHVNSKVDMALIRVESASQDDGELARPLTIPARSPDDLRGREVYVVGYPAWDGRRNDPQVMARIFGDIFNVKRLQPGSLRNLFVWGKTFKHDCSTLGGNSGSCVVDLETGRVIGLHFAGRYGRHNRAVALWKFKRSVIFKRAGIQFE